MSPNPSVSQLETIEGETAIVQQSKLIHSLSNKLLPIVVFSELALRRCQDENLKSQLEKIHGAAGEARDIILEIKKLKKT